MKSIPQRFKVSRKVLTGLGWTFVVGLLLALFAIGGLVVACEIEYGSPVLPEDGVGLKIFDRNDKLVFTAIEDRVYSPVPISKIAKNLRNALVVSEDRDFYHHMGVSLWGTGRAIFTDITTGNFRQGGSTLTQQLIKNLYFPEENKSVWRKIPEAIMAVRLEQRYSKDQILDAYFNYIYFGKGTFGVEEASQRYFGKHAADLNLAESAYLAGIVNAPSVLSVNKKDAIERANEIVDNMVKLKYCAESEGRAAKLHPANPQAQTTVEDRCGYYLNYVVKEVESRTNDTEPWKDGLLVYTNLDMQAQANADKFLTAGIKKAPAGINQGALVSIVPADSAVIAMVGGVGTMYKSPWNRAVGAHTAGSSFKPFVYLAGILANVIKPETEIDDSPLSVLDNGANTTWSPKDFESDFLGPIMTRKALALSRNICAVRIGQAVGPQQIARVATAAGISSKLEPTLALSLGASAVTPLEMANAYSTLARQGVRSEPVFIRRVDDRNKKTLYQAQNSAQRVFQQEPVAEIVDAMQDVVRYGTGVRAQLGGRPVAGKTGTADGARDIWFCGFTTDVVTAVWGGNEKNQSVANSQVTGGAVMAQIWQQYTASYYKSHPTAVSSFAPPNTPLLSTPPPTVALLEPVNSILDPTDAKRLEATSGSSAAANESAAAREEQIEEHKEKEKEKKKGGVGRFFKHLFKMF